ncbi:hypothetical protein ACQ4PT_056997 [Festuca glaucescens]
MVGLNNIKETDFVNVTIQSLMRITPLRNFFLIPENYQHSKSPLVHCFGELTRKIWHARNFKGQVSPHEFLQAVMKASEKRFQIGVQSDPVEFMSWLLNTLHAKLRSCKKKNWSIIYDCFQGELEVVKDIHRHHILGDHQNGEAGSQIETTSNGLDTETSRVPFLMLSLDLPPPPLFKDAMEKNIIPQVLDFDFEKFCSFSLSNLNVYACLVCGKYYQGRGLKSHAYTHSLEASHHVFVNLQTEKVYCLPDGYEINDSSLEDIRHVLNPRFAREQILNLDKNKQWSRALDGSNYLSGMGELEVVKEIHKKHILSDEQNAEAGLQVETISDGMVTETPRVPFLMLGLDLPPPPLFKYAMEKNVIPQVPLFNILKKFDGEAFTEVVRPTIARVRYRVIRLPKYMILHMRRFTKNNFFVEKNPTLVKNLELKDYIPLPKAKENDKLHSKYDLIANIVHDGKPGEGCYRAFVQRRSEEAWYEMQDLHVTETLPQMVALTEAYMQIYEQHE